MFGFFLTYQHQLSYIHKPTLWAYGRINQAWRYILISNKKQPSLHNDPLLLVYGWDRVIICAFKLWCEKHSTVQFPNIYIIKWIILMCVVNSWLIGFLPVSLYHADSSIIRSYLIRNIWCSENLEYGRGVLYSIMKHASKGIMFKVYYYMYVNHQIS